jgi:hypothetical protein
MLAVSPKPRNRLALSSAEPPVSQKLLDVVMLAPAMLKVSPSEKTPRFSEGTGALAVTLWAAPMWFAPSMSKSAVNNIEPLAVTIVN